MDFDTNKSKTARALGAGNAGLATVVGLTALAFTSGVFSSDETSKLKILIDTTAGDVVTSDLPTSILDANGGEVVEDGTVVQFIKASNEIPRNKMIFVDPLLGMTFVYGDRKGETINAEMIFTEEATENVAVGGGLAVPAAETLANYIGQAALNVGADDGANGTITVNVDTTGATTWDDVRKLVNAAFAATASNTVMYIDQYAAEATGTYTLHTSVSADAVATASVIHGGGVVSPATVVAAATITNTIPASQAWQWD